MSLAPPPRWLIVVAEDHPTIRQGLRHTFADDPSVEVVLDRRGTESRVQANEATSERRQPLSPEQTVVWRDLKFFLVDRWKGMEVYETDTRAGPHDRPARIDVPPRPAPSSS